MTSEPRTSSRLPLIVGVGALTGGLWLFLNAQGVGVPPFKRLWPILFVLAGLAILADWLFLSRRAGSAGWAVLFIGLGVLFFTLTLGYTTLASALDWLPAFPAIFGLALLTGWMAGGRAEANLAVAGVVLLGLGVLGFGARFDWLKEILPSAQVVWAVLLLVCGGYLVWRTVGKSRG